MKRFYLAFVLSIAMHVLLSAQIEVPQTQQPVIVKIAADWCPPCGGWGWSFFDDIYADNSQDAILLSVHHSGDLSNGTSQALTQNYQVFGQPRFIFDGVDQNVTSSNSSSKRTSVENMVGQVINQSPDVQVGLNATYDGDNIKVDHKVELFQNLDGEYSLALYLVEKAHIGYQASIGDGAEHKNLLRKEFNAKAFGEVLFSSGAQAGDMFSGSAIIPMEGYTASNLRVVAVIWKKDGGDYLHVNANVDSNVEFETGSDIVELSPSNQMLHVYPTVTRDLATIQLLIKNQSKESEISLIDNQGRLVKYIMKGKLSPGAHSWSIDRSHINGSGNYFVVSQIGSERIIKKLIFE